MKDRILNILAETGIKAAGFCNFSNVSDKLLDCRAKARIPQNAKTVIVCLFPYKVKQEPPENISRYAAVPDYHKVCGSYLEKAAQRLSAEFGGFLFVPFTDNSPIPEVFAAARAGLGVVGKNRLLINKKWGSWCFIGEIVTDLAVECEDRLEYCPGCGECEKICPKKDECLSGVSQKKGELTAAETRLLKENRIVWGCDICAECCPLNKNAEITYIPEFIEGYRDRYTPGEDISGRAYEWRGEKAVKRNFETEKKRL